MNGKWVSNLITPIDEAIYPSNKGDEFDVLIIQKFDTLGVKLSHVPSVKPSNAYQLEGFICEWGEP
ncbi:MAG: hypothetical protein GC159_20115 [Phycisphaera sp.]|nr:hypothetical protein [Phycisphaera sp.]